mgnify:CR=1 FL=1
MRKGGLAVVYLFLIIVLLVSVVSASWFSDLWARIIGKTSTDLSQTPSKYTGTSPPPSIEPTPSEPPPSDSGEESSSSGSDTPTPATAQLEEEAEVEATLEITDTCSDSDKRIDFSVYGAIQGSRDNYGYSFEDTCEGNVLVERYCDEDVPRDYRKNCEEEGEDYICLEGSCILSSDRGISCSDSDGGLDSFEVGATSNGAGPSIDYCKDDFSLVEYYCSPNKQVSFSNIACPPDYICRKGKCSVRNFDLSCEDTDEGIDYNNRGEITGVNEEGSFSSKDRCTSYSSESKEKDILLEYYCDENSPNEFSFEIVDCTEKGESCVEGACMSKNDILNFFRNLFGG